MPISLLSVGLPCLAGLAFERITIEADDLNASVTEAPSSRDSKALTGTNSRSSSSIDWQDLWGSNGYEDGIETAGDGSFLLGGYAALIQHLLQ